MDGIVIILDTGSSVAQEHGGKCFLTEAKLCISRILQRRLFSESKDEVGLVLMGTPESKNQLFVADDPEGYRNISVVRPLAKVDFQAIEFVEKEINPTAHEADWLDAVMVAMDLLKRSTSFRKYETLKIVLLTDFSGPVCVDQVSEIIAGIRGLDIEFMIVGSKLWKEATKEEDLESFDDEDDKDPQNSISYIGKPKTKTQILSETTAQKILNEVDGRNADFETIMVTLQFFVKKEVKSGTWAAQLEIAPQLSIPVVGFYRVKEAKVKTWGKGLADNVEERPIVERSHHLKDEDQTEIERDELVSAYMYGSTKVPFSDEDKAGMMYQSGEKSFKVVGFVDRDSIPWHHHLGDGAMYFVARKGDQHAYTALSALLAALEETSTVIIARKVYRKNSNPQMGFAFPLAKKNALGWIAIPYAEDIRSFKFPGLKLKPEEVSAEDLDLVDRLIDAGDLSDPEKLKEEGRFSYRPKDTLNPVMQRLFECLTRKGLYPKEEIPETVGDHLALLIQPRSSAEVLRISSEIKARFPLEVQEKKRQWARTGHETFGKKDENGVLDQETDAKRAKAEIEEVDPVRLAFGGEPVFKEIGVTQPVSDFKELLKPYSENDNSGPVIDIMKQMTAVIEDLIHKSLGSAFYAKAFSCLQALREEAVRRNAEIFNSFIHQLKVVVLAKKRESFWKDFVQGENAGLITSSENSKSGVSAAEAKQFLLDIPREEAEAEEPENDDIDDLI